MTNSQRKQIGPAELDRIDVELVRILQNNARTPNKELAARVGLAPSSSLERVKRLVEEGVFSGFHADVDLKRAGVGLQAMISVRLTRHSRRAVDAFRAYAFTLPEVISMFYTAGQTDFMIHVAVRDSDHRRELEQSSLTTREEVEHLETSLIFEYRRKAAVPVYVGPDRAR
jgi:DNA-binding Lrp family transcriptional regulator